LVIFDRLGKYKSLGESPELEKVVSPDVKKRPKEALFRAWKNTFSSSGLAMYSRK
jgi:hypothetical protein